MTIVARKLLSIPLWSKWNESNLRRSSNNDERGFARGFHLRAYSDSERLFAHFDGCCVPGLSAEELSRRPLIFATGVDLSSKKRPGNAIVTLGLDPNSSRIFAVDVRFGAWTSPETCEQIALVNATFNPLAIVVEDNAYQASLIEWVQAMKGANNFWAKIESSTTTSGAKLDEERGLPAIEIEFKNEAWAFPADEWTFPSGRRAHIGDPGSRGQWARLRTEFEHHPFAPSSDGVMASWFARQGLMKFGLVSRGAAITTVSHAQ